MSATDGDQAQKLLAMAKQIADFFRPYPEDQAVSSIADHINKFWTRGMRDAFLRLPGLLDGALDPLLTKAAASIRPGSRNPDP